VRLDIRRIETLKDGTDAVGNRTRVKVVKNKMAPPFKQAEFDILYGVGISREGSLIDFGVEHEIVRKSGAWYTYEGDQLGQGKENSRNFLLENPQIALEIEKRIMTKLGIGPEAKAAAVAAAAAALAAPPADSAPAEPSLPVAKTSRAAASAAASAASAAASAAATASAAGAASSGAAGSGAAGSGAAGPAIPEFPSAVNQ
jgi:recombination protein RecA